MLAFVTSLRHPDNAANYETTEILLRETLLSIEAQTSDDYVVIVAGNRAPSFTLPPRTHFILTDFDPPARVDGPNADRSGFVRDKGSKIGAALLEARKYNPSHIMIFDADDFLHRDLVSFIHDHPEAPGWAITDGWLYSRARNGYKKQPRFNERCGTCYILPYEVYRVPDHLDSDASQDEIVEAYGAVLPSIMGAHRNAVEWHREHGRELLPLPFRGAVYHVDTGENHSRKSIRGVIRPWSRRLQRDFAIPSHLTRIATLKAAVRPRAVAQTLIDLARRIRRGR